MMVWDLYIFFLMGKFRVKARSVQDSDVTPLAPWKSVRVEHLGQVYKTVLPSVTSQDGVLLTGSNGDERVCVRMLGPLGFKFDTLSQTHIDIDGLKPIHFSQLVRILRCPEVWTV